MKRQVRALLLGMTDMVETKQEKSARLHRQWF